MSSFNTTCSPRHRSDESLSQVSETKTPEGNRTPASTIFCAADAVTAFDQHSGFACAGARPQRLAFLERTDHLGDSGVKR